MKLAVEGAGAGADRPSTQGAALPSTQGAALPSTQEAALRAGSGERAGGPGPEGGARAPEAPARRAERPEERAARVEKAGRSPLPFGVRLVVCFFALDAIQTAWQLGHAVWSRWASEAAAVLSPPAFFDHQLPLLLALLFDVLLAAMIGLGTRAGRFWGFIYLVSLTGVGLTLLVLEPSRWIDLEVWGRAREIGTHLINLGLAATLLSARSRRALRR